MHSFERCVFSRNLDKPSGMKPVLGETFWRSTLAHLQSLILVFPRSCTLFSHPASTPVLVKVQASRYIGIANALKYSFQLSGSSNPHTATRQPRFHSSQGSRLGSSDARARSRRPALTLLVIFPCFWWVSARIGGSKMHVLDACNRPAAEYCCYTAMVL